MYQGVGGGRVSTVHGYSIILVYMYELFSLHYILYLPQNVPSTWWHRIPVKECTTRCAAPSCLMTWVKIYCQKSILCEFSIHMEFKGEMAVDQGGVTRDMYSAFWEECYSKIFDGSTLLVPMLCPQIDTAVLPIVGSIISHGYLVSGFLQFRIAFPCLVWTRSFHTSANVVRGFSWLYLGYWKRCFQGCIGCVQWHIFLWHSREATWYIECPPFRTSKCAWFRLYNSSFAVNQQQ